MISQEENREQGYMIIRLEIPGEPIGKARPRVSKFGSYTPKKTKNYETFVKELFFAKHGQVLLEGPLEVEIKAYFKIPKSVSKKRREEMINGQITPTKKPDIDNVIKGIADALNDIAYEDDKQIVRVIAEKYYSEKPRAEVTIKTINDNRRNENV